MPLHIRKCLYFIVVIFMCLIIPLDIILHRTLPTDMDPPWEKDFRHSQDRHFLFNLVSTSIVGNKSLIPAVVQPHLLNQTSTTIKKVKPVSMTMANVCNMTAHGQLTWVCTKHNVSSTSTAALSLFPGHGRDITDDGILDQLQHTNQEKSTPADGFVIGQHYGNNTGAHPNNNNDAKEVLKKIHPYVNAPFHQDLGQHVFLRDSCPVNTCFLTIDGKMEDMDAVVFRSHKSAPVARPKHGKNTVYIWFNLESPMYAKQTPAIVNWTATYRPDSTIVAPYEKFAHFANFTTLPDRPSRNYALNKTLPVAWFVSNCNAKNGRQAYAKELSKYIRVDIYGKCGTMSCPRPKAGACFEMLNKKYKFYLSFENSACRYYITEKFFWNALFNDIVPIVMGASPEDYARIAPPNSYIHVDDFESPKHLAEYLHLLNTDDNLYNQYFRWKGTGEFINTKFWCRVCAMLHVQEDTGYHQWYGNLQKWYTTSPDGSNTCLDKGPNGWASWRNHTSQIKGVS